MAYHDPRLNFIDFCLIYTLKYLFTGTECSSLAIKNTRVEVGGNATLECGDEGKLKGVDWYRSRLQNNCSERMVIRENGNEFRLCERLSNDKILKPDFKERFSIDDDQLPNGNGSSSLKIKNIETKDQATYFCVVQSDQMRVLSTSVLYISGTFTGSYISISLLETDDHHWRSHEET